MKRVIKDKELRNKMKQAIDLLCDTVKTTLGPKGSNAIIDHSAFTPFITNDGVTIAENIESEDEAINTILQIAKESSIKTNELVGDGTTTTLVLLQSIIKQGIELLEKGINPMRIKKELDATLIKMIDFINNKKRKPTKKQLYNIARISSNSKEIGKNISEAYFKVKDKTAISIKEGNTNETTLKLKKGYTIETLIASPYFFKDNPEINIENAKILLINNYINDTENVSNVLNYIIETKNNLLILALDYSDLFINQILDLYLNNNVNIILLKIPEYGKNKIDTINDISLISNGRIIENIEYIEESYLGNISNIKITKEQTTFYTKENEKIKLKIKELNALLKTSNDVDRDFISKRIAMLNKGIVEITIGANTQTERREKKMRYDDALCAIDSAKNGIVPGSGIIFYELSEMFNKENDVEEILFNALKEPLKQIIYNAGLEEAIIKKIENTNFKEIYNIYNDKYENVLTTEVIDPVDVLKYSITNAISIAGMLLTTTSLIINEYQNNTNKQNDFNEL